MLTDLDRIVVAARERRPVVHELRSVLGAEVVGHDHLPLWSAKRTTLRAGMSEIEVLEADGVGAVADFIGRRGPGLFAVGFASADVEKFRAHLETQGVFFEEHECQLFLTSDKSVDLPGLNLVITPAKEREPAGLLKRLCGATLLHPDAKPGDALVRILGAGSLRLSEVSQAIPGLTGTLVHLGEKLTNHLAILAPWDKATPIGRFFLRYGSRIYMASAQSEKLTAIRERLGSNAYAAPIRSAEAPLSIPSRLLGGARLAVFADAAACCNGLSGYLLPGSDVVPHVPLPVGPRLSTVPSQQADLVRPRSIARYADGLHSHRERSWA
jgi:hypothetical protein